MPENGNGAAIEYTYIMDEAALVKFSSQLYKKSVALIRAELAKAIAGKTTAKIVAARPAVGQEFVMYLVPRNPADENCHIHDKWMYFVEEEGEPGEWVSMGSDQVNLDGVWTDEEFRIISLTRVEDILTEAFAPEPEVIPEPPPED